MRKLYKNPEIKVIFSTAIEEICTASAQWNWNESDFGTPGEDESF